MAAWTHADLIALSNVAVAVVTALVAMAAPYIAWSLTRRSQKADDRRRVKLNVFGALMQNRHTPQSREAASALNLIDVAFHDNSEVRRLWQEYFNMISHPAAAFVQSQIGFELVKQKLVELQAAMARDLAFDINQFDIQRIYEPAWLHEEEELRTRERQTKLAAFRQSATQFMPTATPSEPSAATQVDSSGFYEVQATGMTGTSVPVVLAIQQGIIFGVDILGCRYSGSYELSNGCFVGKGTIEVPAGVQLVTGDQAAVPMTVPMSFSLPTHLDGAIATIQVGDKQVGIVLRKLKAA